MFYRFTQSGARIAIDLDGLYRDQALFLLGGAPSLADQPLHLLRQEGVVSMAMNNVPYVFSRPNLWVALDKPVCFSPHVYLDPSITKFTMISRRNEPVSDTGKTVSQCPNLFMFGASENVHPKNFLKPGRDFVWWKSVFPVALQVAWRLGFRTVYLAGCGFHMQPKSQYAWETTLTDEQRSWSQRTYDDDLGRLEKLLPAFKTEGFRVVSCTEGSRANAILDYLPLEEAVDRVTSALPTHAVSKELRHSSEASKKPS